MKNAAFKVDGIGYTDEAPGLTPKEITGKYKSSGYGDLNENKLTTPQLSQLKVGDKVKYLGKDTNGFVKGEQYEVSRKESSSTFQPTITIKNKDGKKLRTSNLSKELNEETHSVGSMVKPEGFQVGDKVKYKGMNHEVTRIVDDRIYIKNLKYSGRPDTWVKAVDLKENQSNLEVDKLLKIINTKKAGPEYKKALMDLIAMAEKKSGKTINTKKEALLALDYIEPTIKENENTEKYFVIRSGGSIGEKEFKKEFDSKEKAIDYAKSMNKQLSPGEKSYYKIKYKVKTELSEYGVSDRFYSYEDAVEHAKTISKNQGVVQHVNEIPGSLEDSYEVSDWYDSDLTVISFENGRQL
jgi:hypothetical protein